jgi:hypothetical protein
MPRRLNHQALIGLDSVSVLTDQDMLKFIIHTADKALLSQLLNLPVPLTETA